jgi:hypothetical protein
MDPYGDESITEWHRLSPTTRNDTMAEGLRARVADPLWLLGRQWQVGELAGEDAGSPVKIEAWYDHDPLTRLALGADGTPQDYDVATDGPLETVVEREPVTVARDGAVNRETAVEAGRNFLARLDDAGVQIGGRPARAADFPAALRLADDDPVDAGGERYLSVVVDRALDGHALYEHLTAAGNIDTATDWQSVNWGSVDHAYPGDGAVPDGYKRAATAFVAWYADLYDEPATDERAWNDDRMEYEFAVATGRGDDETVFGVDEYAGGRLDWDAFGVDPDSSLLPEDGTESAQTTKRARAGAGTSITGALPREFPLQRLSVERSEPDLTVMPTKVSFPGMPSPRWWEFEDGNVNLDQMQVGPGEVGKLLLTEFATLYGNDWFTVPVDVPVGSLTRIRELLVTDTFGQVETVDPAIGSEPAGSDAGSGDTTDEAVEGDFGGVLAGRGDWNLFAHPDLPAHDRPGLFYPPVLATHHESDPVERVLFARDEMANMAFGVELLTEDAIGDPLNWREYTPATLAVDMIQTAPSAADERVRFTNPGESSIDVAGWVVESDTGESYQFPTGADTTLDAGESLTLYTGPGADAEPGALFWGKTTPVWATSRELTIREAPDEPPLGRTVVGAPSNPDLPDYRLVSDVDDYWYPLVMRQTADSDDFAIGDLRFELARLVDADADGSDPAGEVLADGLALHDEELTRAGLEVSRTYQLARWLGGSTHLWAGRRAGLGRGEGRSGLRFDYLEEPDPDQAEGR